MVADELCSMNAMPAPVRYPSTGFSPRPEKSCSIRPEFVSAFTAPVMFRRPENRIPKPIAIFPMDLELRVRFVMIRTIPKISATGASVDGCRKRSHDVPPASRSSRRMICPVTVVPTLAPMMMPSDWVSVRIPAPTRPEVITIVAVDDWIRAVTSRPSMNAFTGLLVTCSIAIFSVPEEFSFRESPMSRMPYRNIASPPSNEITSNMLILSSNPFCCTVCKNAADILYTVVCYSFITGLPLQDTRSHL